MREAELQREAQTQPKLKLPSVADIQCTQNAIDVPRTSAVCVFFTNANVATLFPTRVASGGDLRLEPTW